MTISDLRKLCEDALEQDAKLPAAPWHWNHVGDNLWKDEPYGPPHYGSSLIFAPDEYECGNGLYLFPLFSAIAHSRNREPVLARALLAAIEMRNGIANGLDCNDHMNAVSGFDAAIQGEGP